ncbi:thiamine phosphate synthase [Campylobacter insulaenigrae]|nr:thiamine phosphate synthase [Campylobacter insulaenigrae]MCR6571282.1 thiamine phosphate synthase [Campylobacter insulaenigrae]MCR6573064.1 thiamine phosphate synthase [Campylobacter insulaenigrae]MCR6574406.1 thiamine phosphate synthase [Campylobacter insulaenigrae]MCR6575981.1 thiamine phosphate synthase [Campylobacter insulaenigrae]MCR6577537.1 thiamine phosphate synthase [Campylobacter insulaenigrae]
MNSSKLYLVASKGKKSENEFLNIIKTSLEAGVDIIQLREKNLNTLEFYHLALKVKAICDEFKIPFLINDRLDIALAIDASGVHIGQTDLPLQKARKLLGNEKIIGITINHKFELENIKGADYLGVGAVFNTPSKENCVVLGIEGLKEITRLSSLPVIAIGGINENNISMLKDSGVTGVAVIRAIMDAKNPYEATLFLKKIIKDL